MSDPDFETETESEAVTGFHLAVEILRELDTRLGPDFSAAILPRLHARRADLLAEGSVGEAGALNEGLSWIETMLSDPG